VLVNQYIEKINRQIQSVMVVEGATAIALGGIAIENDINRLF